MDGAQKSHKQNSSFRLIVGFFVVVGICIVALLIRDFGSAKGKPTLLKPQLLSLEKGTSSAQELKVSLSHYKKPGSDILIDFIGAVHLGEREYFAELNKLFKSYEVVLYELIADSERIAELSSSSTDSQVGGLQKKMADILGLQFQLEGVDYSAKNFVHADMTPDQLFSSMKQRGETPLQLITKLIKLSFDPELQKSLQKAELSSDGLDGINPLLIYLRGPTESERRKLKKFMAQGLLASDELLKAIEGESGSVLISERNKVAIDVLKSEISQGRNKIAVYYGVGHLPDMHERLTNELGFKLVGVEWMKAWRLE